MAPATFLASSDRLYVQPVPTGHQQCRASASTEDTHRWSPPRLYENNWSLTMPEASTSPKCLSASRPCRQRSTGEDISSLAARVPSGGDPALLPSYFGAVHNNNTVHLSSTHMIHISRNIILYTHAEHSPTKTIYTKYYMKTHTHAHTHTLTVAETGY